MSKAQRLVQYYVKAVQFPEVSGFEVLEMLDVRSKLTALESELDAAQRKQLEEADGVFLKSATQFYENLAPLGDLGEMRQRAAVPCSHWWWYLEKLAERVPVKT